MKVAILFAVAVLVTPALSVAGDARPRETAAASPQAGAAASHPQASPQARAGASGAAAPVAAATAAAPATPEGHVEVPPPPFSEGIFPCSNCHAGLEPNPKRRVLTDMHTEIQLRHDEQHRWCLDCHDAKNRDVLHLASGEPVPFDESYRLCGQCHGDKYRDWRVGVHGRRSGYWNGHKTYLLCAHCHNPHQPRFQPLAPKPAPLHPTRPGQPQPASANSDPKGAH